MLDFSEVGKTPGKQEPEEKEDYQPVKAYDGLDLKRAKKDLAVYDDKIKGLKEAMDRFEVNSERSLATCSDMVIKSAGLIKRIEANRLDKVKDATKFVRSVNAFVKIYRDQVEAVVASGKKKIGGYQYEQELARREAEKKAQEEAEALQKKMDERAKKAGIAPVQMPRMITPQTAGPVRTESGYSSTRMVWTWEAEDDAMDKLSRDYLTIDDKAIDDAIKAGLRQIPGIRIFEKPAVSVRGV